MKQRRTRRYISVSKRTLVIAWENEKKMRTRWNLRYPLLYANFVNFPLHHILREISSSYPCRRLQTRCTITLMDDEELAILGLPTVISNTRYAIRAACCHSGLGSRRITSLSMGIWKTGGSDFQPHRPIREIREWRWPVLRRCMSQMANRWLCARCARKSCESIEACGTLRPRTQDGDGRGAQLHVRCARATTTTPLFSSSRER
jgi:hypothetical protein